MRELAPDRPAPSFAERPFEGDEEQEPASIVRERTPDELLGKRVLRIVRTELPQRPRQLVLDGLTMLLPPTTFMRIRRSLYRWRHVQVGPRTAILGRIKLTGGDPSQVPLKIGSDCVITGPVHIDLNAPVTVGDHVSMGYEVMLLTTNHDVGSPQRRGGPSVSKPIRIGDGAWIGSRAMIFAGVTVGAGAVIGAGAVVTHDVEPNTMVAGSPARIVKRLPS